MKRLLLLSLLVFAVAAFGQEAPADEMAMEETMMDSMAMDMDGEAAMEDSMAMDMLEGETEMAEEPMEEDSGDALEAMLAEEGMESEVELGGAAQVGYTVGLMAGYPVYMSSGLASGKATPVFGVVAATPFGFAVGPLEVGVGAELGYYDFSDIGNYKGLVALATLNTAVLETVQGSVSVEVGGGYYGASVGMTAGATYSYAIPNVPLVVKPHIRANATLSSGDNDIGSVAWINAGIYLSYDIS
ncbi:MAG: hypothetical protein K9M49_09690, partial [Candidatus Marinimicrobia bacterium]|nr:hypothetical protein [Candidatus Neomarinimicrobiota bacterium]MCF7905405.1 hypothetical protein [Candidatus Neomarinimicrobiota bacterium]